MEVCLLLVICNASVCLLKCVNVESLADFHDASITSVGRKMILVAMLRGSRPSDHYFRSVRSVCLFVCLFVCAEFFSAVFDRISIKLGRMLYVFV